MNRYSSLLPYTIGGILLIASIAIRLFSYHIVTADYTASLAHWMDALSGSPGLTAFENPFSNYAPLYLYLLKVLTYIPVNELYAIKTLSLVFDVLLAIMVVMIVAYTRRSYSAPWLFMIGALSFAIPTMFLNSSVWGQCDSIYTFFVLWSLYLLLRDKPYLAALVFGIALSFKLQAIFFLPILVGYAVSKRKMVPWSLSLVPLVYLLSIIPAWIGGGTLGELSGVYFAQSQEFTALTLFAPSIFAFIGDSVYSPGLASFLSHLGQVFALVVSAVIVYITSRLIRTGTLSSSLLVLISLLSVIALPFFLPHMHERYFYLADIFAFVYACVRPSKWYIPVLIISASTLSYMPFLSGAIPELGKFVSNVAIGAVFMLIAMVTVVILVRSKLNHVIQEKKVRLTGETNYQ